MKFYYDEKLYYKRIKNYMIDTFIFSIISTAFMIITNYNFISINSILMLIIYIIIYFFYYFICEYFFQKTLAKYITKTKVTNIIGQKPKLWQIIIR